jgi:hypothetical protein
MCVEHIYMHAKIFSKYQNVTRVRVLFIRYTHRMILVALWEVYSSRGLGLARNLFCGVMNRTIEDAHALSV